MASPIGTTSRQMQVQARWLLASVVAIAMTLWVMPTLAGWGAMITGLFMVLVICLTIGAASGRGKLPGNPIHLMLALPVALLLWNLVVGRLGPTDERTFALGGAMELSLLIQIGLFSLIVLLTQALLPQAALNVVTLGVCGAAMMVSPLVVLIFQTELLAPMRATLLLLAYAGVGVWVLTIWGIGKTRQQELLPRAQIRKRWLQWTILVSTAGMIVLLVVLSLGLAAFVAGVVGCVCLLAGVTFDQFRKRLLTLGGALVVGGVVLMGIMGFPWPWGDVMLEGIPPIGLGELAMMHVDGSASGLQVLLLTIGPVGVGYSILVILGCIVVMMFHAKKRRDGDAPRAVIWTSVTCCATLAFLAPAGMFSPAVMLAMGLTWGLLPQMLSREESLRSGWWLVVGLVLLSGLLGLASRQGLASWGVYALTRGESSDKWMHFGAGLLLASAMAWMMGRDRMRWGFWRSGLRRWLGDWGKRLNGCCPVVEVWR